MALPILALAALGAAAAGTGLMLNKNKSNYGSVPKSSNKNGGHKDNKPPQQQAPNNNAYSGGYDYGYGGGGYSAPTIDQNALAQYDQAIGTTNHALSRLGGQLNTAYGNIQDQFNTSTNELNVAKKKAEGSYNTGTTQNQQSFRGNKNTINDQAASGLRGLLRSLGAMGAGGSSEYDFVAPQAVTLQASQQRSGAGENYAKNQQGLDTNWNNFLTDDKNSRKKLTDWRVKQRQEAEARSQTTRQELLTKLAELSSQRAAAAGGNPAAAAQPYINQANALSARIDALGRFRPTYTGKAPVYTAPTLDSYDTGEGTAAEFQGGGGAQSPFLALLLNQQERQKDDLLGYV